MIALPLCKCSLMQAGAMTVGLFLQHCMSHYTICSLQSALNLPVQHHALHYSSCCLFRSHNPLIAQNKLVHLMHVLFCFMTALKEKCIPGYLGIIKL